LLIFVCPFVILLLAVCPSSIYGFWLSLWRLQSFLRRSNLWHWATHISTRKTI